MGAPDPIIRHHPPPSQHADSQPLPRVSPASYAYFKWKGNHYTGPARPKAMEEGTVLSDSLMSIATWAANNPGKGVDAMLKELAPVPEQEKATEEEVAQAMENSRIWFVICSGCPNRATSLFSPITLSAVQEPSPLKLLLPRRLPRKTETGREGPGRAGNGLRCTRKTEGRLFFRGGSRPGGSI